MSWVFVDFFFPLDFTNGSSIYPPASKSLNLIFQALKSCVLVLIICFCVTGNCRRQQYG